MDQLQCDIMSYDTAGSTRSFKSLIGLIMDIISIIAPQGSSVII